MPTSTQDLALQRLRAAMKRRKLILAEDAEHGNTGLITVLDLAGNAVLRARYDFQVGYGGFILAKADGRMDRQRSDGTWRFGPNGQTYVQAVDALIAAIDSEPWDMEAGPRP